MIVDGRALANEVLARAKARAEKLPHLPRVVAYVAEDPTPATRSYLNIKRRSAEAAGCIFEEARSPAFFKDADAAIIQLPAAPEAADMLDLIPIGKDADVLSDAARQKFARGDSDACLPPVVGAIAEIFRVHGVEPRGKKAVVVGRGFLVGTPAALWLAQQGAQVTVVNRSTQDFVETLRDADIIVSGAGSPRLITPHMLKKGVVLIDAGASESNGEVVGDADPVCAHRCSLFTPVPGGMGPLAVAKLFENAVRLTELQKDKIPL
ncbi:bifunctional 5,10-methylenetetrahydrofolate dehydrogenase/5,10-methenyltetrahydrofolate cyclohydrolase [Patescibacteria group bacterium]|nr:bifunctional 5,10-methylenetetrahydrofolate dehydrogenase/5,10-methenyltetrahydrofolate cyclohydrolase [Patescibacteria group bacterium]